MLTAILVNCLIGPVCDAKAWQIDREQLVRLMQSAGSQIQDFSLEYEGDYKLMRPQERNSQKLGADGIRSTFSGRYSRRSDGAAKAEWYTFEHASKKAVHTIVVELKQQTEVHHDDSESRNVRITRKTASPADFQKTYSYAKLFLRDMVLELAQSSVFYEFEGMHQLDGRECARVRFRRGSNSGGSNNSGVSDVFWIDLERGGQVLQHEYRWGNDLVEITRGIKLEWHQAASGRGIWLPVTGKCEGHLAIDLKNPERPSFPSEPVYVQSFEFLPSSLRLEQGLTDDYFTAKARPGDIVSDDLKKAQYEHGQYMVRARNDNAARVADTEIQNNLDKMLSDSDMLARELKASSPARNGPGWIDILPWGVAVLAALTLIGYLVHRRFVA